MCETGDRGRKGKCWMMVGRISERNYTCDLGSRDVPLVATLLDALVGLMKIGEGLGFPILRDECQHSVTIAKLG